MNLTDACVQVNREAQENREAWFWSAIMEKRIVKVDVGKLEALRIRNPHSVFRRDAHGETLVRR